MAQAPAAAKPSLPGPLPGPLLVTHIRMANNGGVIRIVLDLDGPPRFDPPVRKADRLEITLPGTLWRTATAGMVPAIPLSYRVETAGDAANRLIIGEGSAPVLKALFTLPPDGERSHRLVIDVAPTASPAKRSDGTPPKKRT